ncbi:MAG: DUF3617 family protein [Steroidobacteraceae bacterium]
MRRILLLTVTLLLIPSYDSATAAPEQLEQGLWRIMVTSTTNGKPDPKQDFKVCLGEELKDLAAYFAPQLEGVQATCKRTRQPEAAGKLGYRLQCSGEGFTVDGLTSVTIENSRHFTVSIRTDSRAPGESAIVAAKGEAHWVGACEPAEK